MQSLPTPVVAGDGPVVVRQVWAFNLDEEFALIGSCLPHYSFVGLDTEYPGIVVMSHPHPVKLSPELRYRLVKANVDSTKLIQVGLALSDADGNLPTFGTGSYYVWQFNFLDFNIYTDVYNSSSIDLLLQSQGHDFDANLRYGIHSLNFVRNLLTSGMIGSGSKITWVTYHGANDFAYLIKSLMWLRYGVPSLPETLEAFMSTVDFYFGKNLYDVKHMTKLTNNLYGGLDMVAEQLSVQRVTGRSHHAASDSLVSLRAFHEMKKLHFGGEDCRKSKCAGIIFGLQSL